MLIPKENIIDPFENVNEIISSNMKNNPDYINDLFYAPDYLSFANGFLPWILIMRNRQLNNLDNYEIPIHKIIEKVISRNNIEKIRNAGLFNGLSGIYYCISQVNSDKRYDNINGEIKNYLLKEVEIKLSLANKNFENKNVKMEDFDLVEGFSGILKVLLNKEIIKTIPPIILRKIVDYLLLFTDFKLNEPFEKNPFTISKENQFTEVDKKEFLNGSINLSLSHGITGVLSALIQYYEFKPSIELKERIKILTKFLYSLYSIETNSWPKRIKLKSTDTEKMKNSTWCYGDLMIAFNIFKASKVCGFQRGYSLAYSYIKRYQDYNLKKLKSPTFCHGISGALFQLIIINRYFGIKTSVLCDEIYKNLIKNYDLNYPYFFKDIENYGGTDYMWDKNNFLTGSLGILYVLDLYSGLEDKIGLQDILT